MAILRLIGIAAVFGLGWLGYQLATPFDHAYSATDRFETHYTLSGEFPFLRRYHLFQPDVISARKMPLIVVLHGASQRTGFSSVFTDDRLQGRTPAYVLAPDAAMYRAWAVPRAPGWPAGQAEELNFAIQTVRAVAATYPVDPRRIYITGASQGGVGVFAALARYPGLFAAGVSYAGAWDIREPGALSRAKVWAIHGSADKTIEPQFSIDTVRGIRDLGGDARLTLIAGRNHGWRMDQDTANAFEWMLNQRL